MTPRTPTLCFTCGLVVGDPPRLNRLPEGKVCPACRDRVLDSLPPLLPSLAPAHAPSSPSASSGPAAFHDSITGMKEWTEPPGEERT